MATSNEAGSLMEMSNSSEGPEGDADTEGSESDNERSSTTEQSESLAKKSLSMKRRLALVGALVLCVFTVFTFAFLLPCHKPKCTEKSTSCPDHENLVSVDWSNNFSGITPIRVSQVHIAESGSPDVLLEFRIEEREVKNSSFLTRLCQKSNCHGSGLLAMQGSCGNTLWDLSTNSTFALLVCEKVDSGKTHTEHCLLLEQNSKVVLLDPQNGTRKWHSADLGKIYSSVFVNDMDADGLRDVVIVHKPYMDSVRPLHQGNIKLNLISGATGQILGKSLALPENNTAGDVLAVHTQASGQQILIVGSVSQRQNSSLWAISVQDLLEKVKDSSKAILNQPWGNHSVNPQTGFISVIKNIPLLIHPLMVDMDDDGVSDIVLCIRENDICTLMALNGKNLALVWKTVIPSATVVHKLFAAGKFAKDNSSDIALFVAYNNQSSALLVINGSTGSIDWSFHSSSLLPVAPVSVPVAFNLQQAFIIWLPKLEMAKLILRSRESEREKTHLEGGTKNTKHLDKKVTKLSPRQRKVRDVRQARVKPGSVTLGLPSYQRHVTDDESALRDKSSDMIEETWSDHMDDIPFSLPDESSTTSQRFLDADTSSDWFARSDDLLNFLTQHRVDTSDPHPFENNEIPSEVVHEERHDLGVDSDQKIFELEHELSDLTSSRNEKNVKRSKPKPPAFLSKYDSFSLNFDLSSLRAAMKQHHIRSSNRDDESNFPVLQRTSGELREIFLEDFHEGKLVADPVSKPAHNKRSVQSKPLGADCVRHLDDDSRSLVALLVTRDSKQFVQVMEEKPLYLGADEYKELFNDEADTLPCLRLVPRLTSEPVLRNAEEERDLVYSISYVSEDHMVHVSKIRKMSLINSFEKFIK